MDNLETQATLGTKTKGQSRMNNLENTETQTTLGTQETVTINNRESTSIKLTLLGRCTHFN